MADTLGWGTKSEKLFIDGLGGFLPKTKTRLEDKERRLRLLRSYLRTFVNDRVRFDGLNRAEIIDHVRESIEREQNRLRKDGKMGYVSQNGVEAAGYIDRGI